jgi:uncharacterized short protein YbdD (DUF466 family)
MNEDQRSKMEDQRSGTEVAGLLSRMNAVVRRVIGAPDYSAYVRHMKTHHPECEVVSEPEFLDEQLTARYSRPGSRCC